MFEHDEIMLVLEGEAHNGLPGWRQYPACDDVDIGIAREDFSLVKGGSGGALTPPVGAIGAEPDSRPERAGFPARGW